MEWTRTLSQPSSANSKEAPNFGASMIVRGGSYGDLGQDGHLRAVESPYSTRSPWVGFRCVYELPTSLTEAAALLSEAEMGL
jgi:formylglycine-generating enzyme required for sulfatase activity